MSMIIPEILFILGLILANGLLAMSEFAVVSSRKARLRQWAEEGNPKARAALALAESPGHFLSAIQIGITLIGIFAGAYSGITIAEQLAARLSQIAWLAAYSKSLALSIVVLAITFLTLVIGELVPKRIALRSPERIAAAMAAPMRFLSFVTAPFVHLLHFSTETVLRVLGMREMTEPPVTEDEIKGLMEQGAQSGIFHQAERELVGRIFRLADVPVGKLMTPRTNCIWLDVDDSFEQMRQKISSSSHSRLPVIQGTLDNIVGIAFARDLLARSLADQPIDLRQQVHPPLFVPESMSALKALERFRQSGIHLALVIDEYGGVEGLVTLTDILTELVGEMPPLEQPQEPQAVQREDGSWLLDGMSPMEECRKILRLEKRLHEEEVSFYTLAGFMLLQLGRIPSVADHFEWDGYRFEVIAMDKRRIDRVLVAPLQANQQGPSPALK